MQLIKSEILIIGGGLSGLTLAYFLSKKNISFTIVEARERLGGRILTIENLHSPPLELGATWINEQHHSMIRLLKELGIKLFEQKMGDTAIYEPHSSSPPQLVRLPPSETLSLRVENGTQQIINRLEANLDKGSIHLNQMIHSIALQKSEGVIAYSNTHEFHASAIVSTLPPMLFAKTIKVSPLLPNSLREIGQKTHTWMGDSIKVSLSYKEKFWEENQVSGTIFSNVGPILEMYDQSDVENTKFALTGFLNGTYSEISKEERLTLVLNQLEKYYGPEAKEYLHYEELVWSKESFTAIESSEYILPHFNNGHQVYQIGYSDDRLFLAGTETSSKNSGYMEGAIISARNTFDKLMKNNEVL